MGDKDTTGPRQGLLKNPPVMTSNMSYAEWKGELELWSTITEVPKNKQGGMLFFNLTGDARDTIRAKLTNEVIASEKGFAEIIQTLDQLYLKDANQAGFTAYEEFIQYRRPQGTPIKEYIIQFNLKYSKIKSFNMSLPEGVLAYNLLICANLTDDQQQLCRATVSDMTYDEMKKTIEKVAVSCSTANQDRFQPLYNEARNHTESYFTQNEQRKSIQPDPYYKENYNQYRDCQNQDFEEEQQWEGAFYTNQRYRRPNTNQNLQTMNHNTPTLNPQDEFGKLTTCSFCHSVYHWINNCPHAPPSAKFSRGRSARGNTRGGRQPWRPRSQNYRKL